MSTRHAIPGGSDPLHINHTPLTLWQELDRRSMVNERKRRREFRRLYGDSMAKHRTLRPRQADLTHPMIPQTALRDGDTMPSTHGLGGIFA